MNNKELFKAYPLLEKCTSESINFNRDYEFGMSRCIPNKEGEEIFRCWINPSLSEYQQALTLLHERYHDCPGFRTEDFYKWGRERGLLDESGRGEEGVAEKFMVECEQGIEEMTQEIISKDTRVRNFLINQIRLAKVRLIRDSAGGQV